jgi:hypothetical protein
MLVNNRFALGKMPGNDNASSRALLKLGYANLIHDSMVAFEDNLLFFGANFLRGKI